MKICIIEDDDYKIKDLVSAVAESLPKASVSVFRNYREGALALKEDWDLVVLDMQLPLFSDTAERSYSFAGERLLRQLERSEKRVSVIVVTQYTTFSELLDKVDFDSLVTRLEQSCPTIFLGAVQYSIGQTEWRAEFDKLIKRRRK